MQPGFVSAILPEPSFDEICRIDAREGYNCIEVMCWPPAHGEDRIVHRADQQYQESLPACFLERYSPCRSAGSSRGPS